MAKPILAILTDAIRYDNQHPLRYFKQFEVRHFYRVAPYKDLKKEDLKGANQYQDLKDLEDQLLKLKPDIIQGAEPYGSRVQLNICLLAMRVSRRLNIPLIFPMLENRPANKRFGGVTAFFLKKILKNYAQKASLIFALNDGARRNLLEVGTNPKKIIKMLYGIWGVDVGLFRPKLKTKNLKLKTDYIFYTGRIDEAKGIPYLLEAWEAIKKDFSDIELLFIGGGGLVDKIKGSQTKIMPSMKVQDLPPYFANALFTVVPSVTLPRWEEQVGMVNLQSLACGTPVITTKSGAIPEYINDKVGILVPERDSKALAEAMRKLLKNEKLRDQLGQNGREYILANFDAQKTIQIIEQILLELVK